MKGARRKKNRIMGISVIGEEDDTPPKEAGVPFMGKFRMDNRRLVL
tara:strand:+ start:333 stop:470 length:138 start_codon:yes stop_codon:yes gene_type:complete